MPIFGNHVVSVGRGVDLVNKCDPKTYAPKGPFLLRRKAASMRAGKGRHISLMMPKKGQSLNHRSLYFPRVL